jgi:hypothetical protein
MYEPAYPFHRYINHHGDVIVVTYHWGRVSHQGNPDTCFVRIGSAAVQALLQASGWSPRLVGTSHKRRYESRPIYVFSGTIHWSSHVRKPI